MGRRKTFKYKAVVSKTTSAFAEQWLWRCQQLYNHCLEQRIMFYKNWGKTLTVFDQSNQLPELKEAYPEFKAIGSQVLQDVVERVGKAFQGFFSRLKTVRGRVRQGSPTKAGFPRFRARARYDSFTLKQAGWRLDGRHLKVTGIGIFKLRLSRPIEGKIKTVTIRRDTSASLSNHGRGGWFVSFSCEVEPKAWADPVKEKVGIDVGLQHFCVDSDPDSQPIENPKFYRKTQAKLRVQQRKVSRRKRGGSNRRKAVKLLVKTHQKVVHLRQDFLHKVANKYIQRYQTIHVEALEVANMVKNRHLSKSISDAGWATFFALLTYKAEEAGRQLVKVNPKGTSQRCSNPDCGEIVTKSLAVRIHRCKNCGLTIDRDVNAAINIKAA